MSNNKQRAQGPVLSRRNLFRAGALLGLATMAYPGRQAHAWSSWTNATSPILKNIGLGDCVHEDLVQISYARMLRSHAGDPTKPDSLINPWAGQIQDDAQYAAIAGDTVDIGSGKHFENDDDLATRLYRENLAYLRIGSFWNDAAANTLMDFSFSVYAAESVATFSGSDYYEGAWDVGRHLSESFREHPHYDTLVQFTMNDRAGFIHGMLTSTASHSKFLTQADVKRFALQFLGVAYEYARTGEVIATSDVTQEQAQMIFDGFIDTYGQFDNSKHDMCVSLKVGSSEASIKLPHRRLRLRAIGMVCHTLEDLWCPAHTCRTYHEGGDVPKNAILAFCNYKAQNGNKAPMFGYHIPFDRYATSDSGNSTNWREALTRGSGDYKGTGTLADMLGDDMGCLGQADTYFNTLGMNEAIACITQLLEYLYQETAWDDGVRAWVDEVVMPTYFTEDGQSHVCDAGRRCLHTPTFIIAPITSMKRAYRKAGLSENYEEMLAAAKSYDAWQRGAHSFYSGSYNTSQSKYLTASIEDASIWSDEEGESRLVELANRLHTGYNSLGPSEQSALLANIGCNGCHDMVSAIAKLRGMLQEFSIDLRGSLRSDEVMQKLDETRAFFESTLREQGVEAEAESLQAAGLAALADEYVEDEYEDFATSRMAVESLARYDDGSYLLAVRDMDSHETSVMYAPADTPGIERLEEGFANLTISYTLDEEVADDLNYGYRVTGIDFSDLEENVYLITGTVMSVSAGDKRIVLDLNGLGEAEFAIRDDVADVPQVGEYVCARYTLGASTQEFVGYDPLDDPGELQTVTYPVEFVEGSSLWLLTNADESEGGYRDYLQIDYGSADVFVIPLAGQTITVYYHDEAYGDTTDVDEGAVAAAAYAEGLTGQAESSEADENDELTDAPTPGYLELGSEYAQLNYGNEVFHVANVIGLPDENSGSPSTPTDDTPAQTPSTTDDGTPAQTPATTGGNEPAGGNTPAQAPAAASTPASASRSTASTTSTRQSSSPTPNTGDPSLGIGLLSTAAVATAALGLASRDHVAD